MRQTVLVCVFMLMAPYLTAFAGESDHGGDHSAAAAPAASHHERPLISPDRAYTLLMEGNRRYITGKSLHLRQGEEQRARTAIDGQKPFSTILTCSDSRVPPEIIFDAGIGELFVLRVAGNVVGKTELGTLEYGAVHLGTPLIVVMGHTHCGAVTASADTADAIGNIGALVDKISPAVKQTLAENRGISGEELIEKSIRNNIFQSIEDILRSSGEIRDLVRDGKVRVIGMLYDIHSGRVSDLGIHFSQSKLLRAGKSRR